MNPKKFVILHTGLWMYKLNYLNLYRKFGLTSDRTNVELQYAFVIKLRSTIRGEIAAREFKLSNLQAIIDTAQRYELHHPPVMETWKPSRAHVSALHNHLNLTPQHLPLTVQHTCHAQSVMKQIIFKKIAFSNTNHQQQNFNHHNSDVNSVQE